MKVIKMMALLIFCAVLGFGWVAAERYYRVKKAEKFEPQKAEISTGPPKTALSGAVSMTNGKVAKLARKIVDFKEIKAPDVLLQGEAIKTDSDGQAQVDFGDEGNILLENKTTVVLINSNPDSFLIQQQEGLITVKTGNKPVSIRAGHLLVKIDSGTAVVRADNQNITVKNEDANITIAYEDNSNQTHLLTVGHKKAILFNDSTKTVKKTRY